MQKIVVLCSIFAGYITAADSLSMHSIVTSSDRWNREYIFFANKTNTCVAVKITNRPNSPKMEPWSLFDAEQGALIWTPIQFGEACIIHMHVDNTRTSWPKDVYDNQVPSQSGTIMSLQLQKLCSGYCLIENTYETYVKNIPDQIVYQVYRNASVPQETRNSLVAMHKRLKNGEYNPYLLIPLH